MAKVEVRLHKGNTFHIVKLFHTDMFMPDAGRIQVLVDGEITYEKNLKPDTVHVALTDINGECYTFEAINIIVGDARNPLWSRIRGVKC